MREIRLYGSEGGGAVCSPYPYLGTSKPHVASHLIPCGKVQLPRTAWVNRAAI